MLIALRRIRDVIGWVSYGIGAVVSAAGSAGIRQIMVAISAAAKASTEQSKIKFYVASL